MYIDVIIRDGFPFDQRTRRFPRPLNFEDVESPPRRPAAVTNVHRSCRAVSHIPQWQFCCCILTINIINVCVIILTIYSMNQCQSYPHFFLVCVCVLP